jgi:hypothetical protein
MDNINKLINNFEKNIDEKNIKNAQTSLIQLITELMKYYNSTNLFAINKCENILENSKLNIVDLKIKTIMPKYKKLISGLKISNNPRINNKLNTINLNLNEFMNLTEYITPKLYSDNNFDFNLTIYDLKYVDMLKEGRIITKLNNNNKLLNQINKKNKILIITFDDRQNLQYIRIHNINFMRYVQKHGYEYKYEHIYNHNLNNNPYWYKIYLVKYYLDTNIYDYVMWVDSDTMIIDISFDLNNYLNSYSSDLFFCDDNQTVEKINAGVFIIKNSKIGKQYINDCINNFCVKCIKNNDNKLKGKWAGTCYEQGIMNLVLIKDYMKHSTVFSVNKILCTSNYNLLKSFNNVFIFHYYDTSTPQRNIIFNLINKIEK